MGGSFTLCSDSKLGNTIFLDVHPRGLVGTVLMSLLFIVLFSFLLLITQFIPVQSGTERRNTRPSRQTLRRTHHKQIEIVLP